MTPTDRLFAHAQPKHQLLAMPAFAQRIVDDACLTDEHLGALVVWIVGSVVAVCVAVRIYGVGVALAVGVLVALVPAVAIGSRRGLQARRAVSALPAMFEACRQSLRSGVSFDLALAESVSSSPPELAGQLAEVVASTRRGRPFEQALGTWTEHMPIREVRLSAAALAFARANATGATRALGGVQATLQDEATLAAEVRALSSQATASMRAMILLPAGFLAIDLVGDQRVLRLLTSTPIGRWCLTLGLVLNVVGAAWMHQLVRRAGSP